MKRKFAIFINFLLIFFLAIMNLQAQDSFTTIVGQVINSIDKTPVADVNVVFKNSGNGTKTDDEGFFMIKSNDPKHSVIVFSCVGYRRKEIKIKPGQSAGMLVQLDETNTLLQDVVVIPGANPALPLMKKVRRMKSVNDFTQYNNLTIERTEQNLALLSKVNLRNVNRRIFNALTEGALSKNDSALTVPLFMSEITYKQNGKNKSVLSTNTFSSPEKSQLFAEQLVGEVQTSINFYQNTILFMDKNLISPLSSAASLYYNYFLSDSTLNGENKKYKVNFYSNNPKNLAFNGTMWIDSATLALVSINAKLSPLANINYIRHLNISQRFEKSENNLWIPAEEKITLNMLYEVLADSIYQKPELFITKKTISIATGNVPERDESFAGTEYEAAEIDQRLALLNDTRLLRTAKWLADVAITGYIPIGKIEIGKIQEIMRITDVEGFKMNLPLRTNEKIWKDFGLGGHIGYGFKNKESAYSAYAQVKLNRKLNTVFRMGYTNEYRRIDYQYNNFMLRENPLVTGDADIANTIIGLRAGTRMNRRKEFMALLSTDINPDLETKLVYRQNELLPSGWLPMTFANTNVSSVKYRSVVLAGRLSFGERTYEDHFQRIYIRNYRPLIYAMLQAGQFETGNKNGNYAKFQATVKQDVNLGFGKWIYILQGGFTLGSVPYPLLDIPPGSESYGYTHDKFSLIYSMEYATDKYVLMHNDLVTDGLLFNQIPIIKHLNLREMFSFKILYGGLRNSHKNILDFPDFVFPVKSPYMEIGVGVANIFRVLNLQSVWRLSDNERQGTMRWGILGNIRISL